MENKIKKNTSLFSVRNFFLIFVVLMAFSTFSMLFKTTGHTASGWIIDTPAGCITEGSKHTECTVCNEVLKTAVILPLGHDKVNHKAQAPTCTEIGWDAYETCSRCNYSTYIENAALGHTGEWVTLASDANYERRDCSVCGRYQTREKNYAINFENGAILDDNSRLQITVGALTSTGTGAASVGAAAGLDAFGNERLSLSLVDDVSGKVLKVVQTNNTNYNKSSVKISYTDATRVNADKYLVAEFDIKLNPGTDTTRPRLNFSLYDGGDNNLFTLAFQTYKQDVQINYRGVRDDIVADGKTWYTFRVVSELATSKTVDANGNAPAEGVAATHYLSTHKIYFKERDADAPMTLVQTINVINDFTGHTARYNGYYMQLEEGNADNHTYFLDNLSFIRTSDTNYLYSTCAHANMSAWTIDTEVDCDTDGIATRTCNADGCAYTETEYLSATSSSGANEER